MTGDLHCHTKLSDGSMGIDDIIVLAKKNGVDVIAITDHDCLAGTVRAKLIGERQNIKVVPGVEISSYDSVSGKEMHIIGYMSDYPDRLEGLCHRNLVARKRAAQFMMLKASHRFPITPDLIIKCAQGSTNIYPVHIMTALLESGVITELYGELYHELFDPDSDKNILSKPDLPEPSEVIEAIHDAGGIAVLSNAVGAGLETVKRLSDCGLDGVEIWNPESDGVNTDDIITYAKQQGLLTTGGSNFHGRYNRRCVTLGAYGTPEQALSEFFGYKNKVRRQKKTNDK